MRAVITGASSGTGEALARHYGGTQNTLGLIARVAVRLHPAPPRTATVVARSDDAGALATAAPAGPGVCWRT